MTPVLLAGALGLAAGVALASVMILLWRRRGDATIRAMHALASPALVVHEGTIREANQAAAELLGVPITKLRGSALETMAPLVAPSPVGLTQLDAIGPEPRYRRAIHGPGKPVVRLSAATANGARDNVLLLAVNAEAAYTRDTLLAALVARPDVGHVVLDSSQRVVWANAAAALIFGQTVPDLLGSPWNPLLELLGQIDDQDAWPGGLDVARVALLHAPDGGAIVLDVTVQEFAVEAGPMTLVGLAPRIPLVQLAGRHHADPQIARYARLLERSNKVLEEFATVASHDLQEPLRTVTSYLQLIEQRAGATLEEDTLEFLGFAIDAAQRMQELIQELLEYARAGNAPTSFKPVSMRTMLAEVLESLAVLIRETGAEIEIGSLPDVVGDAAQIQSLLGNLVGNAIKYRGDARVQIQIEGHIDGTQATFAVTDNGIGIDAAQRERIFQLFQRLHGPEEYGGTGMGLAIAKQIVENHRGAIWVESAQGGGSVFKFQLPTEPPEAFDDGAADPMREAGPQP